MMSYHRYFLLWLLCIVSASAQAELTLGVHPFKPPSKLIEAFTPLANYLGEKMGEPVTIRIAKDYQSHVDAAGHNEYDIAYLGPILYVKVYDAYGPQNLLARQAIKGTPTFHGTIFVRNDSNIQSLADLKGKSFAFGEAHSTMSHLVPRYMLSQSGIQADMLSRFAFVGDHVNVALSVLAGDFDAGATKEDVFLQYKDRGLRSLATSLPLSDHVFIASKNLPADKQKKLQEILLSLHKEPRGSLILNTLTPNVTALMPVKDSDYDSLRDIVKKLKAMGIEY
jgi:phosphonate transport system substrate-binding protein